MPWNIGLAGNDFNILNSKINEVNALTYNNIIDFVNYFMITENGNVGINNKNPTENFEIQPSNSCTISIVLESLSINNPKIKPDIIPETTENNGGISIVK